MESIFVSNLDLERDVIIYTNQDLNVNKDLAESVQVKKNCLNFFCIIVFFSEGCGGIIFNNLQIRMYSL